MAVTFHEVWKPAAYDDALHRRLGTSFAAHAFLITRVALRREMLLALMRLWDTNSKSIRVESIGASLRNREVIEALALDRAERLVFLDVIDAMRDDLGKKADEALLLLGKYMQGGPCHPVLKSLRALRHERLAHRQFVQADVSGADTTDDEIEAFYQDNAKLIQTLLSLVNAMAYDPAQTARVYRVYAADFWGHFRNQEAQRRTNHAI